MIGNEIIDNSENWKMVMNWIFSSGVYNQWISDLVYNQVDWFKLF